MALVRVVYLDEAMLLSSMKGPDMKNKFLTKDATKHPYCTVRPISLSYRVHYLLALLSLKTNMPYSKVLREVVETGGIRYSYKKYKVDFPQIDKELNRDDFVKLIEAL